MNGEDGGVEDRIAYDEGYEAGHKAGVIEGSEDADSDTYDNGYEHGWRAAQDKIEGTVNIDVLREEFRRVGFESLEDVAVRYDAALKALVWTQDGRSVTL